MEAIMEVKKGEQPYKMMRSAWLKDKDGPVLFKMLSKQKADKEIEAAYIIERSGGRKTVLGRTTTTEERFTDAVQAFRTMVWDNFPGVDLELEDIEPVNTDKPESTSQYTAAKNINGGHLWLRLKKWLRWR